MTRIAEGTALELPPIAAQVVAGLAGHVMDLQQRISSLDRELLAWFRQNEVARRLETIPGIGVVVATALAATVTDPQRFRSGRQFAAWLGLTPLANSSGGKERMGRISKMGDPYLRRLMVVGATSRVRVARRAPDQERQLVDLLKRKPVRLATVALANRTARIVWALMARGGVYRATGPAGAVPA